MQVNVMILKARRLSASMCSVYILTQEKRMCVVYVCLLSLLVPYSYFIFLLYVSACVRCGRNTAYVHVHMFVYIYVYIYIYLCTDFYVVEFCFSFVIVVVVVGIISHYYRMCWLVGWWVAMDSLPMPVYVMNIMICICYILTYTYMYIYISICTCICNVFLFRYICSFCGRGSDDQAESNDHMRTHCMFVWLCVCVFIFVRVCVLCIGRFVVVLCMFLLLGFVWFRIGLC